MVSHRGDWRGHPDGSGTWRAPLAIETQSRRSAGSFLKVKVVDLDDHMLVTWLSIVCLECGEELILSPSGHQLCANRLCRDGFDVTLLSQFVIRPCG
jgi:hypothetical protein